ncbi:MULTISPECIES: hypothetical protein [unclassified Caballeronia]|uniref:hypothetical protein n=1 Tax=unclassified Caballeronia TaxID=2646786 RepID=UPI001F422DFA|nr:MULTISPECIES: hypothetical protein [unclassified Caballeronia]MCE4541387.1 hypothetical protein [Caballeronia sp. PC1]MCE4569569.1 hypothetical protein [Caballeronia sp. CLC5]
MIKKDVVTPSTGAVAAVHVVMQVSLDYTGAGATDAYVSSYLSQEMYEAGKFPLQTQQIRLDGLPAAGQDPRDYAEALLVQPVPDEGASTYPNRYVLAGGGIVVAS